MPWSALVTGATGFIGGNLAQRLVRDGVDTHAVVRAPGSRWRLAPIADKLHLHIATLGERDRLSALVREIRPGVVFHLAAEGGYEHVRNAPQAYETNLLGTINLMEACARVPPAVFVNAGTSSEYGASSVPMREDAALHPSSAYAIAKAAATHHGQLLARERTLPVITLRIFSAYGPWEAAERFVPRVMLHLLDGTLPPLVAPDTGRDFIHVDDVVDAFLAAAARPDLAGAVLNVGTGHQGTVREVVDIARALSGVALEPQYQSMGDRCWDTPCWVADPERAASALGFSARRDLRNGLAHTWEWFRTNRHLYTPAGVAS